MPEEGFLPASCVMCSSIACRRPELFRRGAATAATRRDEVMIGVVEPLSPRLCPVSIAASHPIVYQRTA